jgi:hypothetical protein
MVIGRLVAWLVLILAAVAEGRDLWGWYDTGAYQVSAIGQIWQQIDQNSLLLAQPAIQRYIAAWLWDPVILTVLLWPAALTFAILGLVLMWLFRRRDRRRRR